MANLDDRYSSYANRNYTYIDYDEKRGYYGTIQKPLYKLDMNTVSGESVTLGSESDQTILTDVAITDGTVAAGDYTLALGTLTESRNLVLTITDADTSISAGTVTITGLDDDGATITDSLDLSVSLTKTTANVYKTISNIVVASLAGEGAGDKIKLLTAEIGLTGVFSVANNAAILSSNGSMVGNYFSAAYNNTSFAVATGTAIDTEVYFKKEYKEAEILLALGLGEYASDYVNGLIYYKKKDSTTAITVNYKYWDQAVTLEASGITIGYASISADASVTGISTVFDADGDNTAQVAKASAGNLYKLIVYNPNTDIAFIQLFDLAAGSVTVGTTAPKQSIPVPAQGGTVIDLDTPMSFATAITYACTTTASGAVDPTTGLTVNIGYK